MMAPVGISFAFLLLLVVIALAVLGGIAVLAMLLAHEQTRAVGLVLLVAVVGVLILGGLLLVLFTAKRASRRADVAMASRSKLHTEETIATRPARRPSPEAAEGDNEIIQPESRAKDSGRVVRALTTALGKALAENKKHRRVENKDGPRAEDETAEAPAAGQENPATGPQTRPAWVEAPPQLIGDAYQMAIKTDPFPTRAECESQLPDALHRAVAQYVKTKLKLGPRAARDVRLPLDYIRQHVVKQQWEESVEVSFGKWIQLHVLLEFDRNVKDRIEQEWERVVVTGRLWYTGTGVVVVLALLSVLFGYLKMTG